jgi:hypothetical protein
LLDSEDLLSFWEGLAVAPNILERAVSDGSVFQDFKLIEALKNVKSYYWWFWLKVRLRKFCAYIFLPRLHC